MTREYDVLVRRASTVDPPTPDLNLVEPDAMYTVVQGGADAGASIGALERAVRRAASMRHHLLVLTEGVAPTRNSIDTLVDVLDDDPLYGMVQPRFADARSGLVYLLPGPAKTVGSGGLSADVLGILPESSITPELLAGCMLLRWNVLPRTPGFTDGCASFSGALLQLLCETRRRGFRNVVVNRTVVTTTLSCADVYPTAPETDLARLQEIYPDHSVAVQQLTDLQVARHEALLAARALDATRRRVLIDCRDIGPRHNGSTQCALGFLEGFAALECADQIDVAVSPRAAEFHRMYQRFPTLAFKSDLSGAYFAAITLTQPWSLRSVYELHQHALVLAFMMLDTIAWDVLYPMGAADLDAVWRFVARHADGLFYISEFTRQRFNARFRVSPHAIETVTHLSFAQRDHVRAEAIDAPVSDHVLVFGNEFDHKDVPRTVGLLRDAFPFERLVVVGGSAGGSADVEWVPSGQLGYSDLHKLIASAKVIVYPSYYEGFGLPAVEGMAYGRPVVVRQSSLWGEIAGHSRLPGPLIEFDDPPSLVEAVGRALAGLPQTALTSGAALEDGAEPAAWPDCAARALKLLEACLDVPAGTAHSRWMERDDALSAARLLGV